jgi:membrane-anchored glycerophosphoryl diester phosphodiesterase (GDPDase)
LTRAAIDDLSGRGVSIGAALSTSLALLLPMIGLGIVVGIAVAIGLVLLIVPGVYLALRWAVAAPVLVVERLGVFASMERSTALTQNHRWAILGLVVLYVIVVMIFYVIIGLIVPGAAMALYGITPEAPSLIILVVVMAVQVLTSMVATVGGAAIYFELRQIKEGVGVAELAQVFA